MPTDAIETGIYIDMNPKTGENGTSEMTSGENTEQNILPGVQPAMPGKISNFNGEESPCSKHFMRPFEAMSHPQSSA